MNTDPVRVGVAGDWHGNARWAVMILRSMGVLQIDKIVHCGDFGIWPGWPGVRYLDVIEAVLSDTDTELWFVDGNHEDFPQLYGYPLRADGLRVVRPHILHIPRGHRWTWHGVQYVGVGGGVSLDAAQRTLGEDFWAEEELTEAEADTIIAGGEADVLISHDCPSGIQHSFSNPPPWWDLRDLARSDRHRERLQRVVEAVQPSHLWHGHLHRGYMRDVQYGRGCEMRVLGFDCDGTDENWAVWDAREIEWA